MGSSYFITYGGNRLTFPGATGSVAWKAPTYTYRTLWETTTPFKNSYSITLSDSIFNYDEYIVYGSAVRTGQIGIDVSNRYVVVPNKINLGGAYYAGKWDSGSTFILLNGTELWLSGTSGYVQSSYFIGQGNNTTAWAQGTYTGRLNDVHPYKIVGVKEVK